MVKPRRNQLNFVLGANNDVCFYQLSDQNFLNLKPGVSYAFSLKRKKKPELSDFRDEEPFLNFFSTVEETKHLGVGARHGVLRDGDQQMGFSYAFADKFSYAFFFEVSCKWCFSRYLD